MNGIKPYEKYKSSGITWLTNIPEHWEVRRAKRVFKELSIKGFENEPLLAATQTKGVVLKSKYENRTVVAQKSLETLKLVEPGNFVISLRSFQGGIELAHDRGIISPAYTVLSLSKNNEIEYFKYLLKSNEYINSLTLLVTGIREGQNIDTNKFKDTLLFLPSSKEQTAIANFLDYKTAKIDRFIRKKKQLTKLLNEQKAGIINNAVTKGLNPNVNTKPSGIEWLGDIPEHWGVRKLKYSVFLNQHSTFDNGESVNTKIALENIESKSGRILKLNENSFEGIGSIFKKGDVLFGKLRPYLAKVVAPLFEGSCVNEILVLTPNKVVWDSEFLKNRMLSQEFIKIVDDSTFGSKMPRASWNFIGGLKISCPPLSEQESIVSYIEKETTIINKAISIIEKEITLVQEYRTALIAEAVTGKIDVRSYAIPDYLEDETYEELEEKLSMVAEDGEDYVTIED